MSARVKLDGAPLAPGAPLSRLDVTTLDVAAELLAIAGHGMIAAQVDALHARLTVGPNAAAQLIARASERATLAFGEL